MTPKMTLALLAILAITSGSEAIAARPIPMHQTAKEFGEFYWPGKKLTQAEARQLFKKAMINYLEEPKTKMQEIVDYLSRQARTEDVPYSSEFVEALSVLAQGLRTHKHWIQDRQSGALYSPRDLEALAAAGSGPPLDLRQIRLEDPTAAIRSLSDSAAKIRDESPLGKQSENQWLIEGFSKLAAEFQAEVGR
jgi:hypothetical protein